MKSRQVERAEGRQQKKQRRPRYPKVKGGPSTIKIHKNRKHREDGKDYF